jgi:hypothetical protein
MLHQQQLRQHYKKAAHHNFLLNNKAHPLWLIAAPQVWMT